MPACAIQANHEFSSVKKLYKYKPIDEVVDKVANYFSLTQEDLRRRTRKGGKREERVRSCNITNKIILQQTKSIPSSKVRKNDKK